MLTCTGAPLGSIGCRRRRPGQSTHCRCTIAVSRGPLRVGFSCAAGWSVKVAWCKRRRRAGPADALLSREGESRLAASIAERRYRTGRTRDPVCCHGALDVPSRADRQRGRCGRCGPHIEVAECDCCESSCVLRVQRPATRRRSQPSAATQGSSAGAATAFHKRSSPRSRVNARLPADVLTIFTRRTVQPS
jgi:hypothetical protein